LAIFRVGRLLESVVHDGSPSALAARDYDWRRPDGPRNVVHQLLHGTTADPLAAPTSARGKAP
jgi:hypothetical protein